MNRNSQYLTIGALLLGSCMLTIPIVQAISENFQPSAVIIPEGDSPIGGYPGERYQSRILFKRQASQADNDTIRLACYYNNQGAMRTRRGLFTVDMIDPNLCTHLMYLALGLNDKGEIKSFMPRVDFEEKKGQNMLRKFVGLKKGNPALKTMLAVEGNSDKYSTMAASPELRANFVKSVMEYMNKFRLDGLDIIWKYPNDPRGIPEDKANFVTLVEELKRAFKPKGYLLSAALPVGTHRLEAGIDVRKLSKQLDFINLMTYDYNGAWDNETGLHAPLFESPKFDRNAADRELNVAWSVKYWLKNGADPKKLNLAITTYGRTFTLEKENLNGINAPVKGPGKPGPYTNNNKLLGYNEICESMGDAPNSWKIFWDPDYKAPYAVNGNQWVGYEDARSAQLKAEFAMSMGLGGVTLNSLCMDDFSGECLSSKEAYPITKAVKRELDQLKVPKERSGLANEDESSEVPKFPTGAPPRFNDKDDGFGELATPATSGLGEPSSSVAYESSSVGAVNQGPLPACGANDQWWFPGPTCKQYYDCTSGDPVLKQCRPGLLWKQSRLWCDHPENVPECRDS